MFVKCSSYSSSQSLSFANMDSLTSRLHLLALPTELRSRIWSILIGHQSARLAQGPNGAEYLLGEPRSSQIFRVCKQIHAEASAMLYTNTTFKASLTSDPKVIWQIVGPHNGRLIKQLEMHLDGYEDCVLYHCTPLYSPDLELLSLRVTSRRWLGNDLDVHERFERLQALFTTRILGAARSKGRPRVIEKIDSHGEVHLEVSFCSPEIPSSVSWASVEGSV